MSTFEIDLAAPDQDVQRVAVDGAIEIGRELPSGVDGVTVADERVSRRHLQLSVSDGGLTVTDLGSTNGTSVNGTRISAPTVLHGGDRVTLGSVELTVVEVSAPAARADAGSPSRARPRPPPPRAAARARPRATTALPRPAAGAGGRGSRRADPTRANQHPRNRRPSGTGAGRPWPRWRGPGRCSTSSRPGPPTPPSSASGPAPPARPRPTRWPATLGAPARHLAGLGSEPWGVVPTICLVDPFPDPDRPAGDRHSGTIVDGARNEIWMVVTPESPPEPLERPMALLFGASLPAADGLGPLLEGYGLYRGRRPRRRRAAAARSTCRRLGAADGELGARPWRCRSSATWSTAAARTTFLRMLASAQPGRLDAAAQQEYGTGMAALEEAWRQKLAAGAPDMKTGQFLRLDDALPAPAPPA